MVRRVQVRAAISAIGEERRSAAVKSAVEAQFRDALRELSDAEQDSKELKSAKRSALYERIEKELQLPFPSRVDGRLDSLARSYARSAADSVYKQIVREKIAIEKRRPDGRAANEIRPIATEVGVTPRTHGSGLFTRGQTQALTLVTLGTAKEEQRIDDLSLDTKKRYIHHYNFPPFSVGRDGLHARARSAATSATARSPSAHSCRSSRTPRRSRTRCAWSPRSSSPTARPRWRPCAARRWR